LAELAEAVQTQILSAPYRVVVRHASPPDALVLIAEANPEFAGIPIHLPLIIGEAAHQLRSALDHLVWQLVVDNTGAAPTGTRTGVPIFKTEKGYNQRASAMIAGVSHAAALRIRAATF